MGQEAREVLSINVELRCDRKCENCERFFDCQDERKWRVYRRRRMAQAVKKMGKIKHKITISGGKGGVGKSTVSVVLAAAFAMMGRKVTVLDQDFDGSTIPRMFGIQGKAKLKYGPQGIIPATDTLGLGMVDDPAGSALLTAGFLILGGALAGELAVRLRLPRISGYLVLGLLMGPYALGFETRDDARFLTLFEEVALGLIALTAGGEFRRIRLCRSRRRGRHVGLGIR